MVDNCGSCGQALPYKPEDRICQRPGCGKTFQAKQRHGKFCSLSCKDGYWKLARQKGAEVVKAQVVQPAAET